MAIKYYVLIMGSALLLLGCTKNKERITYETCVNSVKSRLKSPATATFSSFKKTLINQKISSYPNDGVTRAKWYVAGYVDSQNGFGATVRSDFECQFAQWKEQVTLKSTKIKNYN